MNYVPVTLPFFSFLAGLLLVLVLLLQFHALRFAYIRLGVGPTASAVLLLASLLGSTINVPLWQLPDQHVISGQAFSLYGLRYVMPVAVDWPLTVVAVNLGGAVIPAMLSIYLLAVNDVWVRGALATGVVTALCYVLATPVPGAGIAIPAFIPPLVTAIAALIIAPGKPAPVAYIAGSLGTLVGADLLNLGTVQSLGSPIVSIGGAGTFDGIFLNGILSVLLASLSMLGRPNSADGDNGSEPSDENPR